MNIKMEIAREYGISDYQFDADGKKEPFKHRYCRITLKGSGKDGGDFSEENMMSLEYWPEETYEKQWREGLERLKTHGTSCLIASVECPPKGAFVNCWILYKIDNKIHIQNRMFFANIYKKAVRKNIVTTENCYDLLIDQREVVDEDGRKISEWVVSVD